LVLLARAAGGVSSACTNITNMAPKKPKKKKNQTISGNFFLKFYFENFEI
jgi:hypothetical protein